MSLNRRMQLLLGLAAVVSLAGAGNGARAATLEVTATLPDSCTVGGGTLAFGTVDPSNSTPTANGSFDIQCNAAANVNLVLNGGLYETLGGNGRAMKRSGSANYLNYKLYTNANFSTEWTSSVPVGKALTSGANTIPVYGLMESQNKPGGDYADSVEITLTVN